MADTQKDYSTFFDLMNIPRFIVKAGDKNAYVIEAANQLALKYFDLGEDQILGRDINDFMDLENALHFQQSFEVCASKKRSVTIQALPGVPGSVRVYGFYISPIFDEDENLLYLDVIGQLDVADQSNQQS